MEWTTLGIGALRVLAWPVLALLGVILNVLHWLALPFMYLFYIVTAVLAWPVRLVTHLEALWYFLGWGMVIGLFFGGGAYGAQRLVALVFDLDRTPVPPPGPATGHDAVSYRAARADKKAKTQEKQDRHAMRVKLLASQSLIQDVVREARSRPVSLTSPISPNTGTAATRSGLFQDIILEQTDEEDIEEEDEDSAF